MTADDCIRLAREGVEVDPRLVFTLANWPIAAGTAEWTIAQWKAEGGTHVVPDS